MAEKLILPAEVQVCATCSFWDGERTVDPEMKVVVVSAECEGECLVTESSKPCLHHMKSEAECLWENIEGDEVETDSRLPDLRCSDEHGVPPADSPTV